MKTKIVTPNNRMWKEALKKLVERGEIKVEKYNECLRRLKWR